MSFLLDLHVLLLKFDWNNFFSFQTKAQKFEENVSKKFGWDFSAAPEDEEPVVVSSIFHENLE